MTAMEDSAGGALAEFEMVTDTVEYKLNKLRETWTGVAVNLFDSKQMGMAVDVLNAISGAVDTLTDKLGLFGTAAVGFTGFKLFTSIS